jgi:hypothetical protein
MGVITKERFFSFSYLSFSSLRMCKCTSLVRIFPCDCDVKEEGLEIGEGDSWESRLIDRYELALELERLRILENRSIRGPVDGRSWLLWVIDNVVWIDSWLSIAGAGCGLICIGANEERARKIHALRGLRKVERQVGSARGTRWPAGSSAGRMVARKARWSRGQEPVQGSGSRPESTRGVCGGSAQNRRVTWLSHKTKTGASVIGDEIWACRETSKRRTRAGIARLASRLSEVRSPGIHPMVLRQEFSKCPSGACILVLCNRGSFVFRFPPYTLRGERMAAISWNPSSFALAIFPSYFP